MGSKGNKRHVKAFNTPGFLRIERKTNTFFMKATPGPHPKKFSLPLAHVLRDILKLVRNMREARYILNRQKVKVDGKVVNDPRLPIGLMDVIEIDDINKAYRILPSKRYELTPSEITKEEAKFKLCKIMNITTVRGGAQQLNLHDGKNITISDEELKKKGYKTRGTLKIELPSLNILDYFEMKENAQAIIYKGANVGTAGKITKITKRFGVNASLAEIGDISTSYDYAFIIGEKEPIIDLPPEE